MASSRQRRRQRQRQKQKQKQASSPRPHDHDAAEAAAPNPNSSDSKPQTTETETETETVNEKIYECAYDYWADVLKKERNNVDSESDSSDDGPYDRMNYYLMYLGPEGGNWEKLWCLSEAAIRIFNDYHESDYHVVDLVKASEQPVAGTNYLITFQAEAEGTDTATYSSVTVKTFETHIYQNLRDSYSGHVPTQVVFVRVQGDKQSRVRPPPKDPSSESEEEAADDWAIESEEEADQY